MANIILSNIATSVPATTLVFQSVEHWTSFWESWTPFSSDDRSRIYQGDIMIITDDVLLESSFHKEFSRELGNRYTEMFKFSVRSLHQFLGYSNV